LRARRCDEHRRRAARGTATRPGTAMVKSELFTSQPAACIPMGASGRKMAIEPSASGFSNLALLPQLREEIFNERLHGVGFARYER
jgi:hypothetical protein